MPRLLTRPATAAPAILDARHASLPARSGPAQGQRHALGLLALETVVMAPTLQTGRLTLRPHTVEHAEEWYRIQSDPEVVRYLSWPLRTREQSFAHLQRRTGKRALARRNDFLALAVLHGDTLVGDVSMHLRAVAESERQVEVGWVLATEHAGRGYAREATTALLEFAFTEVRAKTATAVIDERNTRSLMLAERLGFVLHERTSTGRLRFILNHRMLHATNDAR